MDKQLPGLDRLFLSICYALVRMLPIKSAAAVMGRIVEMKNRTFMKTHCVRKNLRDAFPQMKEEDVEHLTQDIARNLGCHIAEMIHMDAFKAGTGGTTINTSGAGLATVENRRQAIYVGGHIGSWEMLPLVIERYKYPLTVIYSRDKKKFINRFLAKVRRNTGARYVDKSQGVKPVIQAMSGGESIALLVDQRVDSGIEIYFFGRPTLMTRLPARLAIKFDCPIVPFAAVRLAPGKVCVEFGDPIVPDRIAGDDVEAELTQKMARAIQKTIEQNTASWFCNTRRWINPSGKKAQLSPARIKKAI